MRLTITWQRDMVVNPVGRHKGRSAFRHRSNITATNFYIIQHRFIYRICTVSCSSTVHARVRSPKDSSYTRSVLSGTLPRSFARPRPSCPGWRLSVNMLMSTSPWPDGICSDHHIGPAPNKKNKHSRRRLASRSPWQFGNSYVQHTSCISKHAKQHNYTLANREDYSYKRSINNFTNIHSKHSYIFRRKNWTLWYMERAYLCYDTGFTNFLKTVRILAHPV